MNVNGRATPHDTAHPRPSSRSRDRDDGITQSVTCPLDREPAEVGRVREWARGALPGWGLSEQADLVELIVSELVTNALQHGHGKIGISLSYTHGDLWIEVTDQGPGRPRLRHPSLDDTSGRGLALIEALTTLNGGALGFIEHTSGPGKTVYAVVPLPPAALRRLPAPGASRQRGSDRLGASGYQGGGSANGVRRRGHVVRGTDAGTASPGSGPVD
jgi:anti-sigma regulatory factor (Ser/Thr protein kinase)